MSEPKMGPKPMPSGAEAGQGLAEYALILSLVALACIVALTTLGSAVSGLIASVVASL